MSREVMQLALDALEMPCDRWNKQQHMIVMKATDALRAELAKPEPEPAGCFMVSAGNEWINCGYTQFADMYKDDPGFVPLYRKDDV